MSGSFQLKTKQELNHVALKVTDMSRAIHFYSEVIGLPVTRTRGPEGDPKRRLAARCAAGQRARVG